MPADDRHLNAMSQTNVGPRLYATTAGYYSHTEGARYISPLVTGAQFPDLVELHESQHEYLALANATDGVARLFAGVVARSEECLEVGS